MATQALMSHRQTPNPGRTMINIGKDNMSYGNITFEMSLKPFRDASAETRDRVCRRLFMQWLALTRQAERLSVLLWTADGSEILDYGGRLADSFEWAYWQGVANPRHPYQGDRPDEASIHELPRRYMDDPPTFTYGWLRELVDAIRRIGREITGLPVQVGATFDPGPEFARSDFKYRRHPEVCLGDTMGQGSMVCCYATLQSDDRTYAGFAEGIPKGTSFGTFLGRQAQHFLTDLGFDYLWLSNGFGFGLETWGLTGAVFDGCRFSTERCEDVRSKSLDFWASFRRECPDYPLQTRGTNLSTGMDLSSDAVPLRDIYQSVSDLLPPPNSPWAALNGDFGLELIGWMSHIAEIPAERYLFRFYTHDPWFLNSPWLDRYQREPHDIYLPSTISRLNSKGEVACPTDLAFLTVDDSWGRMPDQVPNEVIPHILWGRQHAPDAPGPFVWVYPFDEYHDRTFGSDGRIGEVFFGDWFMRGAVNHGFPLNTVISTRQARILLQEDASRLRGATLVTPVPDRGTALAEALRAWLCAGGNLLLYGPLSNAPEWLITRLGVVLDERLEGEFTLPSSPSLDSCEVGSTIRHHALLSAGGVAASPVDDANCEQIVMRQGDAERVAASCCCDGPGRLLWVRGTVSCDPEKMGGHLLVPYTDAAIFPAESLMRWAASRLGWELRHRKDHPHDKGPLICVSRHRNAFIMAGYQPDMTMSLGMRTPYGIPLLTDTELRLSGGVGWYHNPHAWLKECRVFVEQEEAATLRCRTRRSGFPDVAHRLEVTGLQNATVRFFPDPESVNSTSFTANAAVPCLGAGQLPVTLVENPEGDYLTLESISGQMMISW